MSRLASLFLSKETDMASEDAEGRKETSAPTYRILFVDDEANVLKSMLRIFRQENYALLTASSGQEALTVLSENQVQVVISDHRMPGMSGTDLLREIKKRHPATIRIMDQILSELADDPDLTDVLGSQFQSFIPQSGHPTGFFMADVIEEELGAGAIRDVVRNPFEFLKLYNRAAAQNGSAPTLSRKTMTYLASLERQYSKN